MKDIKPNLIPNRKVDLTDREEEILQLIIYGYTSKDVGRLLGISRRTVEIHRRNLLLKFNARNTVALVSKVYSITKVI